METDLSHDNLWDQDSKYMGAETNLKIFELPMKKDVTCVQIYDDILYLGTKDSKVVVFNISITNSQEHPIKIQNEKSFYPHCNAVHFIVASKTLLIVVPLEDQQLIRIWNRETLQILHGYKGHGKQISQVIFLKDNEHIASVSHDGTARIWTISQNFQFDTEKVKYTSRYPILALEEVDHETIAIGGDDCFISIYNWKHQKMRCRLFAHPGSVLCLALYYPFLASAGGDSKLKIWKIEDEEDSSTQKSIDIKQKNLDCRTPLALRNIKEISQSLSQNLFACKLSNKELLILDSKGNIFTMTASLTIISKKIDLNYTQKIRSMKYWQKYIFFQSNNSKGKGQLKFLPFKPFEDKQQGSETIVKTTEVNIRTNKSLQSQPQIQMQSEPNAHSKQDKSKNSITFHNIE